MVRLTGAAAALVIAVAPALVVANVLAISAGILAGLVGLCGVLVPSLAMASVGTVGALLVFSAALLLAPADNAWLAATLMGVAIVALLDAAHYQQRFGRSAVGARVVGRHLTDLAVTGLLSFFAASTIAVVLATMSAGVDATLRPFAAAA